MGRGAAEGHRYAALAVKGGCPSLISAAFRNVQSVPRRSGRSARCFSGCRTLLCRKEMRVATFARLAAVAAGLTILALLAGFSRSELSGVGGYPFVWWTAEVAWTETLPSVFLMVAAELLTSEIVLRKLRPLRESFLHRYGIMVSAGYSRASLSPSYSPSMERSVRSKHRSRNGAVRGYRRLTDWPRGGHAGFLAGYRGRTAPRLPARSDPGAARAS